MSTSGVPGFPDALAEAHAGYHDQTRRHGPPDVLVDDVVTYRMLSPHLMRAGLFLVTPTVLLLIWLLLGYLASMSSPSSSADAITTLIGIVVVVLYLAGVAAFFAPAKEPIAEYARLLEGRAGAAPTAYDWVRRAAEARHAPAELRPSTVAGVPVLVFAQRSERAMLLVQPYGEDLYVGWTMWRSRSSATLLGHFLRDTFGRFAAAPRFSSELRAAATRALRESVHSLSREGVTAALAGPAPSVASTQASRTDTGSWHAPQQHAGIRHDAAEAPRERDEVRRASHEGALPGSSQQTSGWDASAWSQPAREEELYAPRRGRDDAGWGPPPRH
jgi:hypothetical protein